MHNSTVHLIWSIPSALGFTGERLALRTANRLGPFAVAQLHLARATFGSRILIEVRADVVDLSSTAFDEGGLIVVDRAKLHLEQVRLGGPLRVSGTGGSNDKPEVLALRNADAGKMSFAHVDLSRCSFQGAHGLGTVEIESTVSFASAPWWAGSRRFIADEYAWRSSASRVHRVGWNWLMCMLVRCYQNPPKTRLSQYFFSPWRQLRFRRSTATSDEAWKQNQTCLVPQTFTMAKWRRVGGV